MVFPNKFKGMAIEDLQNIETLYAINMFVYELKEDEMGNVHAELTRRSPLLRLLRLDRLY
jgi:hypothetical protein